MRKLLAVTTALTAVTLLGTVAVAAQSSAHDRGGWPSAEVIDLVAEKADDDLVDLGAAGFGLGDQLLISDVLMAGGTQVGRSGGTCQVVQLAGEKVTVNCVTTLELPRGQVTAQGLLTFGGDSTGPFTAAITGGTGSYRSAHGEMLITPVDADTELYRLTVVRR